MTKEVFNSPFAKFVQRTVRRPVPAILGWGVCGFGITAWVGFTLDTILFNPEYDGSQKFIMALIGLVGWMLGGALFGTAITMIQKPGLELAVRFATSDLITVDTNAIIPL